LVTLAASGSWEILVDELGDEGDRDRPQTCTRSPWPC